jgi:heme/copper-type cytochrome/quinol oxidase subunit 2
VLAGAVYLLVGAIAITLLGLAIYSTVGRKEGRLPAFPPRAGRVGLVLLVLVLLGLAVPLALPTREPPDAQMLSLTAQQFEWTVDSPLVLINVDLNRPLTQNLTQTETAELEEFFGGLGEFVRFSLTSGSVALVVDYGRVPVLRSELEANPFVLRMRTEPTLYADAPTLLILTSQDVAHLLGVYAPDGTLLFTVNAMPGETTNTRVDFPAPGAYSLRCLRHCGIGHHLMTASLTVTAGGSTACAGC